MEATLKTYTKREIAHLLNASPRTISDDSRFLNLLPKLGDRGAKLFSQSDFNLIAQLRDHCKDKSKSRDSFSPSIMPEIIEPEPEITRIKIDKKPVLPIENQLVDPLFDLVLLDRIATNNFVLPTNRIAPILGISNAYLSKLKTYFYCGFYLQRQQKRNNQFYWKVTHPLSYDRNT